MTLGAREVTEAMVNAAETGGSAAGLVVVDGEDAGRRLLVVRQSDGTEAVRGSLGSEALDGAGRALATAALDDPAAADGLRTLAAERGTVDVHLEVRRPVRELVIVGAGHIAQPLSAMGALLGFQVTVVDDRPDFATRERFPDAHRLVRVDFTDPFADIAVHAGSHVLLVTRGHKYDYECLLRLMRTEVAPAYIGMIGSLRRVRATYVQLLEEGIPKARLDDIHAPVGLDIGAETPAEIAVAVAAELVKVRRGGTGAALKDVARVAERFFE